MKTALNLCDISITMFDKNNFDHMIEELHYEKKEFDEIYIGSYFCEKYFLHITDDILKKLYSFCSQNKLEISIVVPMATEKDLCRLKERIDAFMHAFKNISAIVVNDFGMLEYISKTYIDVPLVLGRLMFKQSRDIRYDTFRDEIPPYEVCSSFLYDLIKDYPIKGMELDDVRKNTIILNRYNYEVYVHAPMVYISTGMVCEYASAGLPDSKKFRPNSACSHQCSSYCTQYVGANEKQFYKLGRTIYYHGDPKAALAAGVSKEIYFPIESVRKSYENSSTIK